jgi:hypothetical protein
MKAVKLKTERIEILWTTILRNHNQSCMTVGMSIKIKESINPGERLGFGEVLDTVVFIFIKQQFGQLLHI